MRLLQLRYFRDVGKTLSISKAAEMNSIPQPAMSRAIIELEKELGKPLFDRVKKRLYLTQDGAAFLEEVEQMFYYLDKGVKRVQHKNTMELSGKVTLLLQHPHKAVLECVQKFSEMYPLVEFEIVSQFDYRFSEEKNIDFCISGSGQQNQFNHRLSLFHVQVMLALPVDHSLAERKKISLYELENEDFLAPGIDSQLWKNALAHCRKEGFEPKVKVSSDDAYCFEYLLSSGNYVSFVPAFRKENKKSGETSIVLRPLTSAFYISTDLCWDDRYTLSQAAQRFLEFVKSYNFELV